MSDDAPRKHGKGNHLMKTIRTLVLIATSAATLLTIGCATVRTRHAYSGPAKDPAELALILGTTQATYKVLSPARERISIAEVDDDSTVPWYSPSAYPTSVYVEPGRHKLDVQYEYIHGVARGTIWVDAISNRTYQVKVFNPEGRTAQVFFLIEDVTAQTLVGGSEDSDTPAVATPTPAPES